MVKITINGQETEIEEGKTILEAAQAIGVDIPTLCYHKALSPYGACRICTVEIEQNGRSMFQASCQFVVEEGMNIQTESERVVKGRKKMIELLLARAPEAEDILDLAYKYGVKETRFTKKVDDVSWRFKDVNKQPRSGGDSTLRNEEMELISQIAKKPDVVWRGVAVFTSVEHLEREIPLISEIENKGYNFGVYEINPETSPPLSGFMIIDNTELFIAYPPKSIRLTIQHPSIVKLYSEYFDDIWQLAQKVKLGDNIDFKKLHQIENDLKSGP